MRKRMESRIFKDIALLVQFHRKDGSLRIAEEHHTSFTNKGSFREPLMTNIRHAIENNEVIQITPLPKI